MPSDNLNTHALLGLKHNFQEANHLLKHIYITHHKTARALPWYLVIGATQSGKTSLFAQSEIEFIQSPRLIHQTPEEAHTRGHTNWWITRDAVLLDVPGYYLQDDENAQVHWSSLLSLICKQKKLAGVVITLDVQNLTSSNKTKQQAVWDQVKTWTCDLTRVFKKPFLIYFVLTKSDQIIGFKEFFGELSIEERTQAWGVSFPIVLGGSLDLAQIFNQEFDNLTQRLNEHLIWRLHQERDLHKRKLIHHFPLQIATVKSNFARLIYQLNEHLRYTHQTQIRGLYFTSAHQKDSTLDYLAPMLALHFEFLPTVVNTHSPKDQGYFIRGLLKDVIFPDLPQLRVRRPKIKQSHTTYHAISILAGITVILGALWFSLDYKQKAGELSLTEKAITQYQLATQHLHTTPLNIPTLLPLLVDLRHAVQALGQTQLPWLLPHQKQQQQLLLQSAQQQYQQALQTQWMPLIGRSMEQSLQNSHALETAQVYNTLKAYLMMGQPQHLKTTFLKHWLSQYFQQLWPTSPASQQEAEHLLADALALPTVPIPLNPMLVTETRRALIMMPEPLLAYLILKNNYTTLPHSSTPLNEMLRLATPLFSAQTTLLNIYDPHQFETVYHHDIENAVEDVNAGNWIIGSKPPLKKSEVANLLNEVQDLYAADYVAQWQRVFSSTALVDAKDFSQIEQVLHSLTQTPSPFIRLSSLITAPLKAVGHEDKLADLNHLIPTPTQTQASLSLLHTLEETLSQISNSRRPEQAAFQVAKKRAESDETDIFEALQQQAKQSAPFLKNWLTTLSAQSWKLILEQTHHYINLKWQNTILPFYHEHLENRYPLNTEAAQDITLNDFSRFFAPRELLDEFFTLYLKPFVDNQGVLWQWKKIDGLTLSPTPNTLINLERANLIRSMFFDESNQLTVPFSLQALNFQPGIRNYKITFNGQSFPHGQDNYPSDHFTWPAPTTRPETSLSIEDLYGQTAQLRFTGPWAWFKLLHHGDLQQGSDTRHFEVIFELDTHQAKYELVADKPINPFVPGIIDQFECPTDI